ncbi:MAG: hypothetical protein CMF62_11170 [Magnetococcales bacterium]|nr:hypothetical protein [Magnetococcales bacterium]
MPSNYTQHILVLGDHATNTRCFAETLLASVPENDIRYTFVHPNAAQILLRLTGLDYVETGFTGQRFTDVLKTADGVICLKRIETGIGEKLIPQLEDAGIKRVLFCPREGNYQPPAERALLSIHQTVHALIKSNLDWTLLRPTTIFGSYDDPFKALEKSFKSKKRKLLIVGKKTAKNFVQPLHESDFAQAILKAFPNARTFRQTYKISGYKPLRIGFVLEQICLINHVRFKVLPFWGMHRILPKWVYIARKNQPLKIRKLRRSIIAPHEKAFQDFGFTPLAAPDFMKGNTDA